ncbi:acetyl esterase [Paraburkholderia sp. GV068]|uniref:alpha/beta hydrolase n=1 Tax=Paraburkholderia TaxID=1822464 RepID=UPI000D31F464|nr:MULTISPECIES: alpha/beta hydrolase [unclassified Paraburkholderia]PTQ93042.1 acetyl esterase [Paraburkholderia sp. GV072]PUA99773.1 acetyl esterase [Paraburkholderia sp. GV068]
MNNTSHRFIDDESLDPQLALMADRRRVTDQGRRFRDMIACGRSKLAESVLTRDVSTLPIVGSIEDALVPTSQGHVLVRVYRPSDKKPLPTVVFFHGGGFVMGDVESMDHIARKLCRDTTSVVVSADYRLAPEHVYPSAHDDALAVTEWAAGSICALGGLPDKLALAGESAGATLAASTSQAIRDNCLKIPIWAQLLVVPGVDFARDLHAIRSHRRNFPMITPDDLEDIGHLYLADRYNEAHLCPPSPARAPDLSNLPPTILALAGHDPLHEEGLQYANALSGAGVDVKTLDFPSMLHQFFGMFEVCNAAQQASDEVCREFRGLLHRRG